METIAARFQLVGTRLKLRRFRREDAPAVFAYARDYEAGRYTHIPHPYTLGDADIFLRHTIRCYRTKKQITFAIELLENSRVIGGIGLHNIEFSRQNSEMGYVIGKEYWGHGYMTEAVALMTNYCFTQLKLHRVYARVFHPNLASARVLEKNGYSLEGRHREAIYREGQWLDELVYAKLRSEDRPSPIESL